MAEDLSKIVSKLSVLGTQVRLFRGEDLVERIYGSEDLDEALLEAVRGKETYRDMAKTEMIKVANLDPSRIRGGNYEVGLIRARDIVNCPTVYEMLDVLTARHPKARDLWWSFYSEGKEKKDGGGAYSFPVGELLDQVARDKMLEERGPERGSVELPLPFQIFVRDLDEMDEGVSISRLLYFGPLVNALANKKDVTRVRIINQIIHQEGYPYSGDLDAREWCEDIAGAD